MGKYHTGPWSTTASGCEHDGLGLTSVELGFKMATQVQVFRCNDVEEAGELTVGPRQLDSHGLRNEDRAVERFQQFLLADLKKRRDRRRVADDDHPRRIFRTISMSAVASSRS